ncbi:MAG: L,D-transpeptidase/peptidoglycan binding protein [Clostridium sp.]|nr:L,D-transpeptidase/peptidoglycan binding protein [Clostridium sp.]
MEKVKTKGVISATIRRNKPIILKSILITFSILLVVYIGISIFFISHFQFNSIINGINVSGMNVDKANNLLAANINVVSLKLEERNGVEEKIKGKDINLKYELDSNLDSKLEELKKEQNAFGWIFSIFDKKDSNKHISLSCDESLLKEQVEKLQCFNKENILEPKSAYLKYENGEYKIVEEEDGTKVKKGQLLKVIKESIDNGNYIINFEKTDCYEKPKYTLESEELKKAKETADKYVSTKITYQFGDRQEILNGDIINKWISLNEDLDININEIMVQDYVTSLASSYNTFGNTRDFKTSSGTTIKVSGGDYGWVIDKTQEIQKILEDIKLGTNETREPIYSQTAKSRDVNDIGNSYVEIDLTKQHVWVYNDGVMVADSDCVSGNMSLNYGTPAGVYQITYKERNATLIGQGYNSQVSYWMPFNGNVGLHDAEWRYGQFGGNIYLTNGSHGCVNLPPEKAAIIFEKVEKAMPVVCYY